VPPVLGVDLSPLLLARTDIVMDCWVLLQWPCQPCDWAGVTGGMPEAVAFK
jgi:hypothetical protein